MPKTSERNAELRNTKNPISLLSDLGQSGGCVKSSRRSLAYFWMRLTFVLFSNSATFWKMKIKSQMLEESSLKYKLTYIYFPSECFVIFPAKKMFITQMLVHKSGPLELHPGQQFSLSPWLWSKGNFQYHLESNNGTGVPRETSIFPCKETNISLLAFLLTCQTYSQSNFQRTVSKNFPSMRESKRSWLTDIHIKSRINVLVYCAEGFMLFLPQLQFSTPLFLNTVFAR